MKIALVTPAPPGSDFGSETTSIRWERIFEQLGHSVDIAYEYAEGSRLFENDPDYDALVAIGAAESGPSIRMFADLRPDRPLIVALNGRDLYLSLDREPDLKETLEHADVLVVFHDRAPEELPISMRDRTYVIHQGVQLPEGGADAIDPIPLREELQSRRYRFEVCVASHLQEHQDPLRTAKATRLLDDSSTIFVTHLGRVLDARWETQVRRESENNLRYQWMGEVSWQRALRYIKRADLLADTATMAGGANVLSEAIALETPVVASRVPGNVGVLGSDYEGLFRPKREAKLANLLQSAELGNRFYNGLRNHCRRLKPRFTFERERDAWRALFEEVLPSDERP